jgi:hypothetical protein
LHLHQYRCRSGSPTDFCRTIAIACGDAIDESDDLAAAPRRDGIRARPVEFCARFESIFARPSARLKILESADAARSV